MFELNYLYEQLKVQTVESNYTNALNVYTESCYDIIEIDNAISETMKSIEEVSREGKLNLFDKFKTNIATAEKVLSKNKEAALKCNPIKLVFRDFKTFSNDSDIESRYKKVIAYLNKFDPSKASEESLKKYIMDSGHNVQYNEISRIFGNGKERFSITEIIIAKTSDRDLTKGDISSAVKYLESYNETLKKLQKEQMDNNNTYTDYVRNNNGLATVNTKGDINKLRKNAANHKTALIAIADQTYYEMKIQKMQKEFNQAKQIVVKAAHYNPRNLKESAVIQDYIDAMYEFNEE